ncbi:uncharacterized protein Z518_04777 [Rhinocladiella mackenziei CBS 650.93]|uniref:Pre-mRNA-splicing factor SPF27 n=1 Tax=Rhinocladiella mackenziei CBS 650.93 TaxID=1442369 RepID=A0A0D2IUG3_9EURO|nr:uncharacterized protein Z518_04777 [Rhinocladiella mackenziei CBS 650.93]KIX06801.1 hypothetical protein Z518_04777 [Rhinocladiella mackenziei CBS 650.93]
MPLILESHDSLPYIDPDITNADRDHAKALITEHLPPNYLTTPHPSLAPLPTVEFSEIFLQEVNRLAAGQPRQAGIDLSRYEAPETPASDSSEEVMRQALRNAYVSRTFLSGRHTNLILLDEFGKNAWLTGNSQAEEILQGLERELARVKAETERVNKARKAAQEGSKGELLGLEDAWKRGIGQILEIQVATDRLQQLIVERQRNPAPIP